jgi:hypothetical protein
VREREKERERERESRKRTEAGEKSDTLTRSARNRVILLGGSQAWSTLRFAVCFEGRRGKFDESNDLKQGRGILIYCVMLKSVIWKK